IMMGGHHAISGAAAWLALTGSATIGDRALGAGVLDLTGPEVLAGTVVATGPTPVPWTRGLFTLRARVYRSRRVRRRTGAGSGTRSGGAWCCSGSASGTSFDGRTARR